MKNIPTFEEFVNESKMSKGASDFYSWAAMIAHGKYGGVEMSMHFGQDKVSTVQEIIDLLVKFIEPRHKKAFLKDVDDYLKKNNLSVNESLENINEAKLKDNSYQSVLFGKSAKSGKWSIIKSTDPEKPRLQTKEDLYPRGPIKPTDKYAEYCIIQDLGGNRGESLQQDAENHLKKLNSGEINHETAREKFSNIEFF